MARQGIHLTHVDAFVPLTVLLGTSVAVEVQAARLSATRTVLNKLLAGRGLDWLEVDEFVPADSPQVVVSAAVPGLGGSVRLRAILALSVTPSGQLCIVIEDIPSLPFGLGEQTVAEAIRKRLPDLPGIRPGRGLTLASVDVVKLGGHFGARLPRLRGVEVEKDQLILTLGRATGADT